MNTREVIFERRSVRAYTDQKIARKDLEIILAAGCAAPSAVNLQPWYYVAVQSEEKMQELLSIMDQSGQKMRGILEKRFANHPQVVDESVRFIRQLGNAPVCVLVFQYREEYNKAPASILSSIAAGMENMILAAWDLGIASCWLTAPVETDFSDELRDRFAPGKGPLVGAISFGYAESAARPIAAKEGRSIIL